MAPIDEPPVCKDRYGRYWFRADWNVTQSSEVRRLDGVIADRHIDRSDFHEQWRKSN